MDIGGILPEHFCQFVRYQQDCGNFFARVHVHLGPHFTDGPDGVHDGFHSLFRRLILQGGIRFRPGADHDAFGVMGQCLIDFFRNKRHVGMQQFHGAGQHGHQYLLGRCPGFLPGFAVQSRFDHFNVPVADLAPDEIIHGTACFAQLKLIQQRGHIRGHILHAGKDPLIRQFVRRPFRVDLIAFQIHQREAGSVPDFIGKVPCGFQTAPVETHVVAGRIAGDQHEAQGVAAILFDHLQRIDTVAQGFTHLPALLVPHQTMYEHPVKGNVLHEFHAHDQHAGHPEEDDIVTGHQYAGGIELFQDIRFFRPAHDGERPQGRTEPGIQGIFILMHVTAALRAFVQVSTGRDFRAAVITVPDRDAVSPPDLAADAPVVHVFHPAQIILGKTFRHELGTPILYAIGGSFQQRLHLYEPLGGNQGFNGFTAALAMSHGVRAVFNLHQQSQLVQVFYDILTAFIALLSFIGSGLFGHDAVFIDDNDGFQVLPQTHLIVVGVMGRGNLNGAGTEFRINIVIGNNGDLPVHNRQQDLFPYQLAIPLVLRIYGYRRIAGDGFRTGSGNGQVFPFMTDDRVPDIPQMARVIFVFYFNVA